MKIYAFDEFMSIREPGSLDGDNFKIEFTGHVNDGEEITVRSGAGKYAVAVIKNGTAVLPADFFEDGETYTLSIREKKSIGFAYRNKIFYYIYDGVTEEMTKMWHALISLAERIDSAHSKVSTLIDGYVTE